MGNTFFLYYYYYYYYYYYNMKRVSECTSIRVLLYTRSTAVFSRYQDKEKRYKLN